MKALLRELNGRIRDGERNSQKLIAETIERIMASPELIQEAVARFVRNEIEGRIANAVKPAGKTSRVPAGQQGLPWADLPARVGYSALRRNVRRAYSKMARARIEAEIIGIIDSSEVDIDSYETLRDLCEAAGVPGELVGSLAA